MLSSAALTFCSCFDLGDQFLPYASYNCEIKKVLYILDFVPEVYCHDSSLVICKFAPHQYFYCFGKFDKFLFAVHLKAKLQLVD